ncbi:MAG: hypothetical protein OXJ90_23005 [Spirochaetaceae bacterium]|nr:hypothetical protein [Spirochaetaceae bacterium]
MQAQMAALDPLSDQRHQRRQVLCEPHRARDPGERPRAGIAQHLQGEPCAGMNARCPAHRAERDRHRQLSDELAILAAIGGQRPISSRAAGVQVGCRLHGPRVVAGRQRHRGYAVHDPLVVGDRTVGIVGGHRGCPHHPLGHLRAAAPGTRQPMFRAGEPGRAEVVPRRVGDDRHQHRPAAGPLQQRAERLARGVDLVGAHRVAGVKVHLHLEHAAGRQRERPQAAVAAAARHQRRHRRVHLVANLGLGCTHRFSGGRRTVDEYLHRRHRHPAARCDSPAAAQQPGGVGGGGDHRRLLGRHRHGKLAAVDQEPGGDPQGHRQHADRRFDHKVGQVQRVVRRAGGGVLDVAERMAAGSGGAPQHGAPLRDGCVTETVGQGHGVPFRRRRPMPSVIASSPRPRA